MHKHRTRATGVISGVAAALLAFGAWADDPASQASFETLDQDGNGQLSATEAAAHDELGGRLAQLDSDGDGAVSRDEFERLQLAEAAPATSSESASSSSSAAPAATDDAAPAATDEPASAPTDSEAAATDADAAQESASDTESAAQTPPTA